MRGRRRFSQAISEGDGISLLAEVRDAADARAAEASGAEGVVVRDSIEGVREATELPILWSRPGSLEDARLAGADAYLLVLELLDGEEGRLERVHAEAIELGFDCVVEVRDEDELRLALDRVDPEILLLSGREAEGDGGLEYVLGLLPDVPAGKLVVADVGAPGGEGVAGLERVGIDAVIVAAGDVATLVGDEPPNR